ncbi:MAG: response regulator, partial [Burkholderiales bacterium]
MTVGRSDDPHVGRYGRVRSHAHERPSFQHAQEFDLQLPDGNGIELVDDLEQRDATEVVMITGHATVESAVNALRAGASDY